MQESIGSMTDGGGKEEEVSSKISMEESMEQGHIALDESGNLMDDVKIGGVIAGGVIAAGMKVAPKKYRKKYKTCQKKLRQFVKRWKERHPCIMRVAKSAGIISGGVLTYLDLITDVNATDAMYQAGHNNTIKTINKTAKASIVIL